MNFLSSTKSVLSGNYQSSIGSQLLIDGRSRTYSPLRPISTASLLGLQIMDLTLDGTTLFICGSFQNQASQTFAAVYKFDLTTYTFMDSYFFTPPSSSSVFMTVTFDSTNVYACGRTLHEDIIKAVTVCLDKNNLSSVKWVDLRFYTVLPLIDNWGFGVCVDATHAYITGAYSIPSGLRAFRVKVVKTTGAVVWDTYGVYSAYRVPFDGGSYIDIPGSGGGVRFIDRIDKVANTSSMSPNYSPLYYDHYNIDLYQGNYYVAGIADLSPFNSLIACFTPSTRAQNWVWVGDLSPSLPEYMFGITVNSYGVYGLGMVRTVSYSGPIRMSLVRLSHNGVLQWAILHENPTTAAFWGIVTYGDSLIVGTYDNPSGVPQKDCYGYVEKRSPITGRLLPL